LPTCHWLGQVGNLPHDERACPVPAPAPTPATIRAARPGDWRFLDHLQRRHHHAIGFLSRAALEHAIATRLVVLALENGEPAGFLHGKTPYQRRPDVAIIFQAAVCYDARRRLLGTALVEAFAARLPHQNKQLCLWCASDLDASLFWSALGFRAVAARTGAAEGRGHLFWCRHPAAADEGSFWVPEFTSGGVARRRRAVVPYDLPP
jgi:hypothetical protein